MIILGIDPGFAITGYGVVQYIGNKFKTLDYGAVETHKDIPFPERLEKIFFTLETIIEQYRPDAIAIEELFFNKNVKTALQVGHGRGVAVLAAARSDADIFEYTPLQVKQAVVGYGRADKRQVQEMVKIILNLKEYPKPDDVADALAVAICHAHSFRIGG